MMFWRLLAVLSVTALGSLHAQLANQPPVPVWIGAEAGGGIERSFVQEGRLLKAILLVAAGTETEVLLNDRVVGTVRTEEGEPAKSLDVTAFIREGTNELCFKSVRLRVAALLELNGDLARKQWVVTDGAWTGTAGKPVSLGAVDADPAKNPFDFKKTFDAYNSWQLAKRDRQSQATDAGGFTVPEGFQVELMRSAGADEDSWVAMAFDPQGRITLAREKKGLLRWDMATDRMEVINENLEECRGLLYAHGALYAHANDSKGLYRLADRDGDGSLDEVKELVHTEGGVGHGRNHLKLGPDGHLWLACGNNVLLPSPIAEKSPLHHYAWDQVLPNPWDGTMFDGTVEMPAGYIMRVAPDGSDIRIMAGGLRNPLDIAFNKEGELFTFDADMERDVGAPWYMPNRVLHVVSGADFGWRRGTGRLPAGYVDTLPSVVDIGLASPTAVFFGYGASFPARYQETLFICDWSYGRIIAVDMKAQGASYAGTFESFVTGRPLNVTDGCIGPDGAMWFTTGGRGTQSGLYRVTWKGKADVAGGKGKMDAGKELRNLRHELETLHTGELADEKQALRLALSNLDHADRHIRWAARVALERLPVRLWQKQILGEPTGWRSLLGCLALTRAGEGTVQPQIYSRLLSMDWQRLDAEQQLAFLRVMAVNMARHGPPSEEQRSALLAMLEALYPQPMTRVPLNRELCRLLIALKSPQVIAKTLPLLQEVTTSEDLLFYPLHLRYLTEGWTLESRRVMFEALNRAEKMNGASTFFKTLQDTRSEMAATMSAEDVAALAAHIHPPKPVALAPHAMPGHTYKVWKMEDLEGKLDQVGKGRSFENGRAAAITAQCVFCHQMSPDRSLPAGLFGPELVNVSARFSRRDLLDHILNPSKVVDEKFRYITVTRQDGSQVTGSLESEDDERVILKPNPLSPEMVEVGKSMIRERQITEASPMPAGLLNSLKLEQILDLLAFIEAGGEKK
ncbi:hypothetical protein WJU23_19795 [Prosthecobacter sp. SYSU 5D2]|uniref:DUF7133 domain-containing protein n=1 Tax=Prosthecobacter sp. SYSU 5D2 TaxID=3134134 RepID=UPI0031FF00A4